ncbi:tyrosine-type recombinase/integrase [Psittacicella hinzii]|uniref:Integrase DNA-binding domain-containing protein n=1 Tax=Psittacicella hinzii TaxID=2028575 RepID=A0A3A1YQ95_9GAMM|nr:integrase arm-type DNA-binding domain-containing protein [Psittacicella hinzii]RIY39701.1 hypothetical protein CKF58_01770 [Psittacicella hinzii]
MYGRLNKSIIGKAVAKVKSSHKALTLSDGGRLQLRLSPSYPGKGSWSLVVGPREKQVRVTIGEYHHSIPGYISIEQARQIAIRIKKSYQHGIPAEINNQIQREAVTLEALIMWYIDFKRPQWAERSYHKMCDFLEGIKRTKLATIPVSRLTPKLLKDELNTLGWAASTKSDAYTFIKSAVNYAIGNRMINDCKLPKYSHLFSEKVMRQPFKALDLQQIPEFFRKLKLIDKEAAASILLIILTACRCNEVLKRSQQDKLETKASGALWYIPAQRMKRGLEHTVFLPQPILKLLSYSPVVYHKMQWELKKLKFSATMHGFRSLFFSTMIEHFPQYKDAISACISHGKELTNHSDKSYHRYDFEKEKILVFSAWYEILLQHGLEQILAEL